MQAPEDQTDTFRLEVIELLSQRANFPLLSANIFLKSSLVDFEGNPVEVNGAGCYPKDPRSKINWLKASQPTFHLLNAPQKPLFQPYTVIKKAGLKIAIIGIDHANTPIATTPDNVKHLCFRDEKSTYYDTQKYLEKTEKPDIYVLIIHDGDVPEFEHREGAPLKGDFSLSTLVKNLLSGVGSPDGKPAKIDAVIAGHTHTFNEYFIETNDKMKKVPLMQAGSQGLNFGRIDLVWDSKTQALNNDKTRVFAPVLISLKECSQKSNLFCHINSSAGTVLYEEVKVTEDEAIKAIIEDKKSQDNGKIKAMLQKELGSLDVEFNYDRIKESVLANFLTDSFLKIAKHEVDDVVTGSHKVIQADIAFLNASGIRRSLVATGPVVADGPFRIVTYEDFFKVLPISNEGVFLYPVNMEKLYRLIQTSIMTCGAYGALMPSGLRVTFEKDCNRKITKEEFKNLPKWIKQKYEKGLPGSFDPANAQVDFRAKIIKIETTPQDDKPLRVLFENGKIMSGYEDTVFTIATLDFLADGGSGYGEFIGIPKVGKIETTVDGEITHVLREVLSESFAKEKKVFHAKIDSRWLVVEPSDDNGRLSRPPTVLPKKPVSPEPLDPEPK